MVFYVSIHEFSFVILCMSSSALGLIRAVTECFCFLLRLRVDTYWSIKHFLVSKFSKPHIWAVL